MENPVEIGKIKYYRLLFCRRKNYSLGQTKKDCRALPTFNFDGAP